MTEGLLGFAAMFVLMALRVPIAVAMGLVGLVGVALMRSWPAAISSAAGEFVDIGSYTLSVVPLFVLMGNFVTRAGMSRDLYRAAYALIGHYRGGLASSTIAACAGFGAICGSSIATTATMARVAMPEMQRFHYSPQLAAGSVCAGATLGILIPPSVILVIYGIMTEQSIGALFAAGIVPGLLATAFYLGAVAFITRRHPGWGPPGERAPWSERFAALRRIWGVLLLFAIVMGGMYGGFFTPTEAAGVGAMGGFVFALARRALDWRALLEVLTESARTSAMLFAIII
ncbi:MAG TPA: TRAP transporter large permease subunit, partial [Rubrivivax sp.]|nr:TRAP transporter large permease subunit [Rubrivivax sp.]